QGVQDSLCAHLANGPFGPLRVVLKDIHQDVGVDQQHQSSGRSSFIRSSVRQRTSARPRTASKRSLCGRRWPLTRLGLCSTTSPAAFTENCTGAPGSSCSSSRMRLGIVTWPLLVRVVAMQSFLGITVDYQGNTFLEVTCMSHGSP